MKLIELPKVHLGYGNVHVAQKREWWIQHQSSCTVGGDSP